ncbi:MAG TPA: ester cyclase [Polyangiaceae bacterium]|jgi:steroid delta-isomerase-like uncharacterized protein|nr:ester cyclase [Polyangiaceae bacterium]
METTTQKDLAKRYFERLNARDIDGAVSLASEDLVNHAAIPEAQGQDGLRRIMSKIVKAFPDAEWTCQDVLSEGDRVVCRVGMRGTNTGPLEFLRVPLPATGRKVDSEAIHIFRVAGGKIAEHWAGRDDIAMMRQLGHLPFVGAQP